jgi:hypothetical protein
MLKIIIKATLLITGIVAQQEKVSQTTSAPVEICLETNGELKNTHFHSKQHTHLFKMHTNQQNENERETI